MISFLAGTFLRPAIGLDYLLIIHGVFSGFDASWFEPALAHARCSSNERRAHSICGFDAMHLLVLA